MKIVIITPRKNPATGDIKINAVVLIIPLHTRDLIPAFAIAAPINPPIRACAKNRKKYKKQKTDV